MFLSARWLRLGCPCAPTLGNVSAVVARATPTLYAPTRSCASAPTSGASSPSSAPSTTATSARASPAKKTVFRGITIPWESSRIAAANLGEQQWEQLGKEILNIAQGCDAGPAAFEEALVARQQLETMLEGAGYAGQMSVAIFGGAVVNGLMELGGDIDFVAVCNHEPSRTEASTAVLNIAKELRRLGLRSSAVPNARVPLVKTDRVSNALPGAPVHPIAQSAVFRYMRAATPEEQSALESTLRQQFGATRVEWNGSSTLMATFPQTTETVRAIAWTKRCGDLEIPLRLPVDPKHGPEVYRYAFDLCLSSSGLQNSHLFHKYMSYYPFSRHLLLFLKRWARACGIINTHDGMLASYAVSVMFIHFLVRVGVIPPLQLADAKDPQALPKVPEYHPLEDASAGDVATLGFLAAYYLDYFSRVFKYDTQVVCTTTKRELGKAVLRWGSSSSTTSNSSSSSSNSSNDASSINKSNLAAGTAKAASGGGGGGVVGVTKPPFFTFCIKDPYNTENIARNISPGNTKKIQSLHDVALKFLLRDAASDPKFVTECLIDPNGPAKVSSRRKLQQQQQQQQQTGATHTAGRGSAAGGASLDARASGLTGANQLSGSLSAPADDLLRVGDESAVAFDDGSSLGGDPESEMLAALSPEAEARREITKMAFESRKESLHRVGEATVRSHEQTRAAQDLTRTIVNWMRSAAPQA